MENKEYIDPQFIHVKHDKQNIFFCSDYHHDHKKICIYDNRPFANVEEMHEALISNWNSVVTNNDIVYYLGDLSFGAFESMRDFVNQLNGKINIVLGNHDHYRDIKNLNRFDNIYGYGKEIWIKDECEETKKSKGYQQIILSHYPILSWNRQHYSSIHLHGHSHQALTKVEQLNWYYNRKVLDVGCNGTNYTPLSYTEVKELLNNKTVPKNDSHI